MPDTPTLTCPTCGKESPADQKFCGNCGARLDVPDAAPVASAAPVAVGRVLAVPVAATIPTDALARARERDRLLTLVNVQRVRGQFAEALQSVDAALALSDGASDRDIAPIHELRGDLFGAQGKWEDAQAAFEKAFALDSERAGAEKKFAEATLRIAEAKAIASGSMLGLQGDGLDAQSIAGRHTAKPGVAVVASLFVPGFGQLVNGEIVKAGICLGVFLLTLLALRLSPDSAVLFAKVRVFVSPGDGKAFAQASEPLSPLLIALLVLLGLTWAYSLFDAASSGGKGAATGTGTTVPPAGDRSGWEV